MNKFASLFIVLSAVLTLSLGTAFGGAQAFADASSASGEKQAIRLFREVGGKKKYFTGYDWLQFDINQKIALIERAREGALQMAVVMTLPAEIYVKELDRMFGEASEIRYIELGQAIEGVAITLKDWDDGRPDAKGAKAGS